ncbi:hypothetical protein PEC106568_38800 [Pectobacterium carotovorum subsp. carotovorum]|nr:hypothetical protein PEC106568_38800 [Pectobacterium carotovorum subsp. carotovorum]
MSESRLWLLAWIFLKQGWVMRCHCDIYLPLLPLLPLLSC